jgi:GTP cyclohydrolase III
MKQILEESDETKIRILHADLLRAKVPENMTAFYNIDEVQRLGDKLCTNVYDLDNYIFLIHHDNLMTFYRIDFILRNPELLAKAVEI